MRSINIEPSTPSKNDQNSIILEEKELDESTKMSDNLKKGSILPDIKSNHGAIHDFYNINSKVNKGPKYYYKLRFEKGKLGAINTRVIKEAVNRIKNK